MPPESQQELVTLAAGSQKDLEKAIDTLRQILRFLSAVQERTGNDSAS
jgi:hypothetical protein